MISLLPDIERSEISLHEVREFQVKLDSLFKDFSLSLEMGKESLGNTWKEDDL